MDPSLTPALIVATVLVAVIIFVFARKHRTSPKAVVMRMGKFVDYRQVSVFEEDWRNSVRQGVNYFVIDFSRTRFIDSRGLGNIFLLNRHILPSGGRVVFASPSLEASRHFDMLHLDKAFRVFSTVDEALAAEVEALAVDASLATPIV